MEKIIFQARTNNITEAVKKTESYLKMLKLKNDTIVSTLFSLEDVLDCLIKHADPEDDVTVRIFSYFGNISLKIQCKGTSFEIDELKKQYEFSDLDEEEENVIRELIRKVLGDNISISHKSGINHVQINVKRSPYRQLINTVFALIGGIVIGLLLKNILNDEINTLFVNNLFAPIYTMFLNALKMIVGPLVLFSIASSIADFDNLRTLGKIAGKVILLYVFTSILAIITGRIAYFIAPIGNSELMNMVIQSSQNVAEPAVSISIKDTIINIIPKNIISPFLDGDMLQIIFMAVLLGIGVSLVHNEKLTAAVKVLNSLMSKITAIIISFMPIAVFCSMAKMILTIDMSNIMSVFAWVPVCYLGHFMMIAVYMIILLIFTRLNPLQFIKKFSGVMLTGFSTASSNATMPSSMKACEEKLGIASKIYSFSIPLGATINMDGSCVTLIITAFYMAKIFGVEINGSLLFTIFVMIMVLSMGAPGVPGGNLICISILLPCIGIPSEAISIIMGVYSLVGMSQAMTNVTGDAVVTTIIASSEKAIDLNVYNA
ncbi:MAG: dicarboxylate/amino acid:cation symporter [Erysipelotrichaceae bacterium]